MDKLKTKMTTGIIRVAKIMGACAPGSHKILPPPKGSHKSLIFLKLWEEFIKKKFVHHSQPAIVCAAAYSH